MELNQHFAFGVFFQKGPRAVKCVDVCSDCVHESLCNIVFQGGLCLPCEVYVLGV